MFKKILKFFRFIFICTIWSYIYLYYADFLMIKFWHFNILSYSDWMTIESYWDQGGIIKQSKDYMFLSLLILIIPIWMTICYLLCKIGYLDILLYPVYKYNQHITIKYGNDSSRIILRNMGRGKKITTQIEEMVAASKPKSNHEMETSKIRHAVEEKLKASKNNN